METITVNKEALTQAKKIDWGKTLSTDDLDNALNPLRGSVALLQALEIAEHSGTHTYSAQALYSMQLVILDTLKELEGFSEKIEYMDGKIRAVWEL